MDELKFPKAANWPLSLFELTVPQVVAVQLIY